jgi:WXG100 family type VII secretion target
MAELEVDPIDLHTSSAHMEMHHAELMAAHTAANDSIAAAQPGWVGASGAALRAKFAEWEAVTLQLTSDIAAHGTAFLNAAAGYAATDNNGADTLDQQF